ncbi:MAG: VOC family protein [Planctomycetota bacterium]|nr:VOC family protein [Planctomycetota bacterium]
MPIKFTHNAFLTKHYKESLDFYTKYCDMRVVKDRPGETPTLPNIAWLAPNDGTEPIFVIAEAPGMNELSSKSEPVMRHFGFELESRHAVDRHYRRVLDAGLNPDRPAYWGETAGYLFFVRDPDGRVVEFSAEQDVSPANWD